MKVIFDPDISEDLREDILRNIEEENLGETCKVCGSDTLYVALIDKILDVKCYECGTSYLEIELTDQES